MVEPILQSDRLQLCPCQETDSSLLHTHWTEPQVRRYLFDDQAVDRETVTHFVEQSCDLFRQHRYGLWIILDATNGIFQGVCGLWHGPLGEGPELLFSVVPRSWGRGIATESALCVLRYAFEDLKLSKVSATVDTPNVVSVHILEKLGMTMTAETSLNGNPIRQYGIHSSDHRDEHPLMR